MKGEEIVGRQKNGNANAQRNNNKKKMGKENHASELSVFSEVQDKDQK
ncbi:hypothetical protein KHA80_20725 [Anaerobacillus sp. HL2]|nr:hypothetical protein KHA80_20725 [Anaerobacillus sp. HL2]